MFQFGLGALQRGLDSVKLCKYRMVLGAHTMNRRKFCILANAFALGLSIWPANGADNSPIVGTWRIKSYSILTLETNETTRPNGDNPRGYIQYSPGGHMIAFLSSGEQKKPAAGTYTDAEPAEAHKSIFGAYAGRYSVEGNKVIHHVEAAWLPHWVGIEAVRFFEINGRNLTIKTAPQLFSQTGKQIVSTLAFEKVE